MLLPGLLSANLDGQRSKEQTIAWLQEFMFATRNEAEQQLRSYETYRSCSVNQRLGEDLVEGTTLDPSL